MSTDHKHLHQYDLGAPLSPAEIEQALRTAVGGDAMRAVLQHLRNKAAGMGFAGRQPPPTHATPGDYRAYHDGAEDALGEVFAEIHTAVHSAIPEDEENEKNA